MPQNIMLSGTTSHAFAAIMTATVVMFPTPSDLWNTLTDRAPTASEASLVNGGVARVFPANLDRETPISELTEALGYCAEDQAGTLPIHSAECAQIMALAAQRIREEPGHPDLALTEQKLKLAITFFCRQQWAAAQTGAQTFDVVQCRTERGGLAEDA